jgi:TnpA family transposase
MSTKRWMFVLWSEIAFTIFSSSISYHHYFKTCDNHVKNNNKKNSRTLAALHEYDRMIKCLYLLEYMENKTLRQFVQQALCRGESYHQLRRAIASINGNQFRGGNDYEIEQWNDCARLIANCIIFYNSALLSGLVNKFEKL